MERKPVDSTPERFSFSAEELASAPVLHSAHSLGEFGAFHHFSLQAVFPEQRFHLTNQDQIKDFILSHPDPEDQLHAAMEMLAYTHELRHFHDCFGTVAGIQFIGMFFRRLRGFFSVCHDLAKRKLLWRLPVQCWPDKTNCPDSVSQFLKEYSRERILRRLFLGNFIVNRETGYSEDVWRDGIFLPFKVTV